jgi:hypothetical protein
MALATCKACDKSVCLMCVVDEKEGTFCSADCHTAFANGQEVPKFVGAAAESSGGGGAVQKIDSIFDDGPSPSSSAATEEQAPAPEAEPMPIVAEGTKWRAIGSPCTNHTDTPAVANCDRCSKAVCALCLLEAAQGTFCSSDCMGASAQDAAEEAVKPGSTKWRQRQPQAAPAFSASAEKAALQGKPVFKFKEPPKSNKSLITVAVILLLAAGAAGAYYGWNAFVPESYTSNNNNNNTLPPDVTTPDTTKPDVTKPDATKPDVTTPDTTKPDVTKPDTTKPDTTKPDTTKPDVTPYVPPRPTVKPPPRPVAIPTRSLNPWADTEPGAWFRFRTTRAGKSSYTDIGLKEKGKDFVVLLTQTSTDGQASAISEAKKSPELVYLRGEETFTMDGQTYLCEIQSPGTEESAGKTWSLLSGRYRGAVLKAVTPEGALTTRRVWDHTMRVRGTTIDCLVVEGTLQGGAGSRAVKSMYAGSIPMGLIFQEKDGVTTTLLDMGSDWAKRPAFPK